MLKSFLEYIFESESKTKLKLYYSKRFRDFLSKIERTARDRDVERLTSAIRHSENSNQMYSDITLIDMTDKNDMLSFIQVNRVKRRYDDPNSKPTPEHFDDFDSWIEFIWNNEPSNSLWKDQRGEVKVGKFTKKIFKDNNIGVSDATIEKFTNIYKATFDFDFNLDQKLELVSGEDIRKWYLETNYSEKRGQLASSCMRYEKCQKYLDIYVQNPEVCNLLIMYSDASKTKICGRALVWKNINGEFVMDRIYTINDYDIEVFRKYASSKEWIDITKNHKVQKIQLKKDVVYDYYPYMDNFYIFNYKESYLVNNDYDWPSEGHYKLQNTDGSYNSDEGVWSEYHQEYIEREYSVWCENANDWVREDDAIWLEYKNIFASPSEEVVYSEWFDGTYYLNDVSHSEIMNDYIPTDESRLIFVNAYGDEDYIVNDFAKDALVKAKLGDEEVETLNRFVIFNPLTGDYHFNDEKVGDIKIREYILNGLSNVEVDIDQIKQYLIDTDFKINTSKLREIQAMYRVYSGFPITDNNLTKGVIKYLLFAYPNKSSQRDGMPILPQERGLSGSDRYLRFKNSMINFDSELLNLLTENDERVKRTSHDTIFNLTCLSQAFISDVFQDLEIYKMWYKWKNS